MATARGKHTGARTVASSSNTEPASVPQSASDQTTRSIPSLEELARVTMDAITLFAQKNTHSLSHHHKSRHDENDSSVPSTRPNTRSGQDTQGVTEDAPLTTRGARRTRRGTRAEGDERSTKSAARLAGRVRSPDNADDVETSRRERVEAVVIPAQTRRSKRTAPGMKMGPLDMEMSPKAISINLPSSVIESAMATATLETMTMTTMAAVEVPDIPKELPSASHSPQEERMQDSKDHDHDDNHLKGSPLFSKLSISPPPSPMMFDREDTLGEAHTRSPWMMALDPEHPSSQNEPQRIIPDLTLADLDSKHHHDFVKDDHDHRRRLPTESGLLEHQEDHDDSDDGGVEDGDDPFGFFKVERRLQRTKDIRPKLLAINEVNNRSTTTSSKSSSNNTNNATSSFKGTDRGSIMVFRERLDQSVLERVATRRRGDVKGKGRAIDRGHSSNSSELGHEADRSQSNTMTDPLDEDLQKVIQLSRGLNGVVGEGSSSCWQSTTLPPSSDPNLTNNMTNTNNTLGLLTEPAPQEQDDDVPFTRSHRRISRSYGRAAAINVDADATVSGTTAEIRDTSLTTTSGTTGTHDQPSRKEEKVEDDNDDDEALQLLPLSTPPRKVLHSNRLSIGSDDLSPIEFETTPKKKPEAGMPLSMDFSPSSSTRTFKDKGHVSRKPHKYLLTEQLEAMLPRRPRRIEESSRTRYTGESESWRDVVAIEDSDDESDTKLRGNKNKNNNNKKIATTTITTTRLRDRQVVKQRPPPSSSSSSMRDMGPLNKKRRASTEMATSTPASKRSHVQQSASTNSSKNKAKTRVDTIGWSASQVAAHKERIKYFQLVDDFELDVETV